MASIFLKQPLSCLNVIDTFHDFQDTLDEQYEEHVLVTCVILTRSSPLAVISRSLSVPSSDLVFKRC